MNLKNLAPTLTVAALGLTISTSDASEPPQDLVDVSNYVHDLVVSKPYATTYNFTGEVVYRPEQRDLVQVCKLKGSAALKVDKADEYLKSVQEDVRLLAWDCYRPPEAQTLLWNAWGCPSNPGKCSGYIAAPGRSKHNIGYAFDGSLADADGNPLEMPTPYDTFTSKAHPSSRSSWTEAARKNWDLYNAAFVAAACKINPSEWWHVDC